MRAFVTGGTGFIGGRVAERLRGRGDEVVALVRSPSKASALRQLGCELLDGDLADESAIRKGVEGCDSAFHIAAVYKVGIRKSERPAMWDANVRGTERVLDAAIDAGTERIVYVSTVNAFGNTRGQVVDETYERPGGDFVSAYDETKWRAHQVAKDRIARGAPIVIVQPGVVYGPGDPSEVGNLLGQLVSGKLKMMAFGDMGGNFTYVDDVAEGILLAHDRGAIGESYVLGGEIARLRDFLGAAARLGGVKLPREAPSLMIKMGIPFGPLIGRAMGFPPNLGELVRASDGVTYWARDDKARRELGYSSRGLEAGLRDTLPG